MEYLLMVVLLLTALFLITLVLVQRGKGGGLAGAFGGLGGQSAFGAKAGDVFTRITIGVAAFWIVLCVLTVRLMSHSQQKIDPSLGGAAQQQQSDQDAEGGTPLGDSGGGPAGAAPGAPAPSTPSGGGGNSGS